MTYHEAISGAAVVYGNSVDYADGTMESRRAARMRLDIIISIIATLFKRNRRAVREEIIEYYESL